MHTTLITGSNRGIGFELVQQYAKEGWQVLACCRNPATANELNAFAKKFTHIKVYQLDVTSEIQTTNLAATLAGVPIDILINNAGIGTRVDDHYSLINRQQMHAMYLTNAIAPLEISKAFIQNIAQSQLKKIIYISSDLASIGGNINGGISYSYRASKAAGNCLMKNLSIDLKSQGIKVLIIHPGWVKTDMGGSQAPISKEESVFGIRQVIASIDDTGVFYSYDGRLISW
jgi:NAD(P)-dependent dehydrogenase (short-subunit alcohol dehydrogenase family)